jgi:chromosomal replication initiator protein
MNKINNEKLLNKFSDNLKNKIGEDEWTIWFKPLKFDIQDKNFIFKIPTLYYKKIILERFEEDVLSILKKLIDENIIIDFDIEQLEPIKESPNKNIKKSKQINLPFSDYPDLNSKYTFDTFIVGDSNQFAQAAAFAVAKNPGVAYNPLFIYGGVGLGKTHLMQAIGHYVKKSFQHLNVVYITVENFTNEYINSLTKKSTISFREKYRNIDVFLIDDVQFLAGKEQLQEEFFHTFNTLFTSQKQLVISSDRSPNELKMEERIKTRFACGLLADIQPPKIETRIAILKKLALYNNLIINDEVINHIATKIRSNIRELEGAFNKIVAYSSLMKIDITIELANQVLKDFIKNYNEDSFKKVDISDIQKNVSEYYGVSVNDLKSSKRTQSFSKPRHIAMYLCRELTDYSLHQIGIEFGGRDHSTVINACQKVLGLINSNSDVLNTINLLKQKIKNND